MSQRQNLIQTNERVKRYGEVFSPTFIVQKMCDYIERVAVDVDHKVLDPACGTGSFLCEILRRRLQSIQTETQLLSAVATLYGVDILPDNIQITRNNLANIIQQFLSADPSFAQTHNYQLQPLLAMFLEHNLICADFLHDHKQLIFVDWQNTGKYHFVAHPQSLDDILHNQLES